LSNPLGAERLATTRDGAGESFGFACGDGTNRFRLADEKNAIARFFE
jgi:hypothetical protein